MGWSGASQGYHLEAVGNGKLVSSYPSILMPLEAVSRSLKVASVLWQPFSDKFITTILCVGVGWHWAITHLLFGALE